MREVEDLVDGLRIRNRSQAVEYLLKKALGEEKTIVILCGGDENKRKLNGSYRFTGNLNNSTVIEETIKNLKKYGFNRFYIIARENILTEIFRILGNGDKYGIELEYEKEKTSNGSMDTLRYVKGKINSNFLVVFGDVITNLDFSQLWESHIYNKGTSTLLLESFEKPSEKGVVEMEGNKITRFVQKPEKFKSHIAFIPIFVTSPEILEYEGASLEEDIFPKLAREGLLYGHITSAWNKHVHTKEDLKVVDKKLSEL